MAMASSQAKAGPSSLFSRTASTANKSSRCGFGSSNNKKCKPWKYDPSYTTTRRNYRLIMLGDAKVGKTALKTQFVQGFFPRDYDPTIEDCFMKQLVVDKGPVLLEILDTGGREEFSTLRQNYTETADAYLLVFDVTNRKSFENLRKYCHEVKVAKDSDDVPVVLVANKCDLVKKRQVPHEEIIGSSINFDAPFIETSARKEWHVDEAFHEAIRRIRAQERRQFQEAANAPKKDKDGMRRRGAGNGNRVRRVHKCSIV